MTYKLRDILFLIFLTLTTAAAAKLGLMLTMQQDISSPVALSRHFLSTTEFPLSTGGIVVKLIGALFAITVIVKEAQKLLVNHHFNPKYKEQNYV